MSARVAAAFLKVVVASAAMPELARAQEPLEDNSFLIEEAYNQQAGAVQHIANLLRSPSGDWAFSFTQEWPLGGMRHQLSYTLLFQHRTEVVTTGLGDALLNYRYQLVGSSGSDRLLVAPRLSLLLPTGSAGLARGTGSPGLQGNLPVTFVMRPRLVTHLNAGLTLVPWSQNTAGARATTVVPNLGASAVWMLTPLFNPLLEFVWYGNRDVAGPGRTVATGQAYLNPGARWGFDLPGRVQMTVGAAYTVGLNAASDDALFAYLSFEHPFRRDTGDAP
ncbi:MAG TPA: hypothetical protein VFS33_02920 [Gemmatimonadales bacterium]|nr:hypothetical protein [Gemmatimonadales bacterium]